MTNFDFKKLVKGFEGFADVAIDAEKSNSSKGNHTAEHRQARNPQKIINAGVFWVIVFSFFSLFLPLF